MISAQQIQKAFKTITLDVLINDNGDRVEVLTFSGYCVSVFRHFKLSGWKCESSILGVTSAEKLLQILLDKGEQND